MKTISIKTLKLILILVLTTFFVSCESEDEVTSQVDIPSQFSVDIPPSISNESATAIGGRSSATSEVIEGEDIYQALRYYIHLGEQSAEILEFTLGIGVALETSNVRSFTFESEDDSREKRIDLVEGVTRSGQSYEYEMTIIDTENDEMALQLLWNTNPVEGYAILKPYNINRLEEGVTEDAFYRVDYTEDHPDYEAAMTVSISGAKVEESGDIDNMKMFVGKNGDIVEVMGNSNHPNLTIVDPDFTGGRNYAFVARGNEATGLGVVNLWLPASDVATNDFEPGDEYSVFAVLDAEIKAVANLDQSIIDAVLAEALSPAYFNDGNGFITSGEDNKPTDFDAEFVDLSGMKPFVPNDVKELSLDFIK